MAYKTIKRYSETIIDNLHPFLKLRERKVSDEDYMYFPLGLNRVTIPFAKHTRHHDPEILTFNSPFDYLRVMPFAAFRRLLSVDPNSRMSYVIEFSDDKTETNNVYILLFDADFKTPAVRNVDEELPRVGISFRECGIAIVKNWK